MADLRTSWPASFRDAQELPPEQVGALVEALIAELDRRDPDPDMEDSETGSGSVDDRGREMIRRDWHTEDDEQDGTEADNGYAEWTSLHGNRRRAGKVEGKTADSWSSYVPEDAEDDDPKEDDNSDRCPAGDDSICAGAIAAGHPFYGADVAGVGSEDDAEPPGPLSLNPDRNN